MNVGVVVDVPGEVEAATDLAEVDEVGTAAPVAPVAVAVAQYA